RIVAAATLKGQGLLMPGGRDDAGGRWPSVSMRAPTAAWDGPSVIALRSEVGAGRMAVPLITESLWAPEFAGRASMFLSDSLPVDASLLESAIRDFFDRLGELG